MKKKYGEFPKGWDAKRVKRVIDHYENQSDEEAIREDDIGFANESITVMHVPTELVPKVRELLASNAKRAG